MIHFVDIFRLPAELFPEQEPSLVLRALHSKSPPILTITDGLCCSKCIQKYLKFALCMCVYILLFANCMIQKQKFIKCVPNRMGEGTMSGKSSGGYH